MDLLSTHLTKVYETPKTKMTTTFTIEHDKFEQLLFFHSTHDVHKFTGEQTTFLILRST